VQFFGERHESAQMLQLHDRSPSAGVITNHDNSVMKDYWRERRTSVEL
jgi:hypothetical protein